METLLVRRTMPFQDLAQHMKCTDYIKRINQLYFEATRNPTELAAFKASMANNETRTSTSNAALYAWKVTNTPASQSQVTSDTGANQAKQAYRLKEASEKAKATYKHIMMESTTL